MTKEEMIAKIETLKEYEQLLEEAKAVVESLKDELKTVLVEQNTEEMEVGTYIIRYTSILSTRFDSTAFKKVMPDVYKAYTKQVASKRFTVSA